MRGKAEFAACDLGIGVLGLLRFEPIGARIADLERLFRADGRDETTVPVTINENWAINYYAIGTSGSNVSISVSANESDKNSAGNYKYGATIKVSVSANDGYKDATYTVKKSDGATIATTNNEFTMPDCNVTIEGSATKKPTCFETGTLIYMADGTKKPIETTT